MTPSGQRVRLDSWKAIANYLDRNVRTVTRWAEQKGMPVHRVPGGKRQAVFAYADEIDSWLNGSKINQREQSGLRPEMQVSGSASKVLSFPQPSRHQEANRFFFMLRNKGLWFGVAVCAIALVWVINVIVARRHTSAAVTPTHFVQLTDDGRRKAKLRTDGNLLYFDEFEGVREVLFSVPVQGGLGRRLDVPLPNVSIEDVSRDGRRLLVTSFDGIETERPLWIVPSSGGASWRVGEILCQSARWSPDNQRIAYVTGTAIGIANSDGTHRRILAAFPSSPSHLTWAPGGERLRFVLGDSETAFSTWEVRTDIDPAQTSNQSARLPLGPNCCADWSWTFDGQDFFELRTDQNSGPLLDVMAGREPFSSSHVTKVDFPVKIGKVMAFTPDRVSDSLYFLIQSATRGELLRIDSKSKSVQSILPGLSASYVSFSRDGRWMTYVATSDNSLWRSRSDGTDAKLLTPPAMEVEVSSWSPDGRTIAFMGRTPGKLWRIFLVDQNGGELTEAVQDDQNQGAPSWSPDGKTLIYGNVLCQAAEACWIHRVNMVSRKMELLPGSHGFRTARFSPDGKYVAALQAENHELMIFDVKSARWRKLAALITGDNINWSQNSRFIFTDSPQGDRPVIERIRVVDGKRTTEASLVPLQKMFGHIDNWFGLLPDDSPILLHLFNPTEIYALNRKSR